MIRALNDVEVAGREFRHLLWLAAEVDDDELDRIIRDEVTQLTVWGVVEDHRVVAFVAFGFDGADAGVATIEYIAVAEAAQKRGYAAELVAAVRQTGGEVFAQTDDDAVGFYRRLGFAVTTADPDPRWPERQRYNCVLTASAGGGAGCAGGSSNVPLIAEWTS